MAKLKVVRGTGGAAGADVYAPMASTVPAMLALGRVLLDEQSAAPMAEITIPHNPNAEPGGVLLAVSPATGRTFYGAITGVTHGQDGDAAVTSIQFRKVEA